MRYTLVLILALSAAPALVHAGETAQKPSEPAQKGAESVKVVHVGFFARWRAHRIAKLEAIAARKQAKAEFLRSLTCKHCKP